MEENQEEKKEEIVEIEENTEGSNDGIKIANEFISMYNQPDIGSTSLVTSGIFIFVYAIYFYITYSGYKNIVKNNI